MSQIVTDSLLLAAQSGFTSVALPALGTGNLHFPRDVVADTMFKTVMDFSKANPGTSVKDVRFVLYDKDQPTIDVSPNWKTFSIKFTTVCSDCNTTIAHLTKCFNVMSTVYVINVCLVIGI